MTKPSGSAVMADRDELARVLFWRRFADHENDWMVFARWHHPQAWFFVADCFADADAILASDWLARVRADEREACAKVAETRHERWKMPHPDDAKPGEVCCDVTACEDIAAAIRERNQ